MEDCEPSPQKSMISDNVAPLEVDGGPLQLNDIGFSFYHEQKNSPERSKSAPTLKRK